MSSALGPASIADRGVFNELGERLGRDADEELQEIAMPSGLGSQIQQAKTQLPPAEGRLKEPKDLALHSFVSGLRAHQRNGNLSPLHSITIPKPNDEHDTSGEIRMQKFPLPARHAEQLPPLRHSRASGKQAMATWASSPAMLHRNNRTSQAESEMQLQHNLRGEKRSGAGALFQSSFSLPHILRKVSNHTEHDHLCKLYRVTSMFGSKCQCGKKKSHPCHLVEHECSVCGFTFTALSNATKPCKVHPGSIQVIGSFSGGQSKNRGFMIFAWSCCPDHRMRCASFQHFKDESLPHRGYHQ